ncbi:MAG: peroxide stress protein YaaA [Bacteroidales bacterium]|nr:peroxide stress protein YaaA [Bacteroidales bacterium]
MYLLISPAKSLDFKTTPQVENSTKPSFETKAAQIVKSVKKLSNSELMKLMSISKDLANLNYDRFQQWGSTPDTEKRAALFAFKGDVYQGLKAETLTKNELLYAQSHLGILSGLYGILRPLDLIEPYRLEMGTNLSIGKAKNLYDFWKASLKKQLLENMKAIESETIINLASQEYFKSIPVKELKKRIISPVFKDLKNGEYKIVSFYAKKARGQMTRYLLQNQSDDPSILTAFSEEGYTFNPPFSTENTPVFTRG